MVHSMTGFGSGRGRAGDDELSVEVRSVNHKFLDLKCRLPKELSALEPVVQRLVKDKLGRGAVDVSVRRAGKSAAGVAPQVDLPLAQAYVEALRSLARPLNVPADLSLRDVALLPGVLKLDEPPVDLTAVEPALEQALQAALAQLATMRLTEGAALLKDLEARLELVVAGCAAIRARLPEVLTAYRQRLGARVAELLGAGSLDPARVAQEVVLLAERTDVAEELTRLESHVSQFRALLRSGQAVGRKLDFLVQEMHREVNTTGSKSQDAEIALHVVALKTELERVREQVQNVE